MIIIYLSCNNLLFFKDYVISHYELFTTLATCNIYIYIYIHTYNTSAAFTHYLSSWLAQYQSMWSSYSMQMCYGMLTHWGRDKMATVSQTTLSNAFSWMKMLEFLLRFHWSLFLWIQLTIFQHWFREWLGAGQATRHYLNQWWLVYWRIYASLGLNELRDRPGNHMSIMASYITNNSTICSKGC